jgi:hypothetical protein
MRWDGRALYDELPGRPVIRKNSVRRQFLLILGRTSPAKGQQPARSPGDRVRSQSMSSSIIVFWVERMNTRDGSRRPSQSFSARSPWTRSKRKSGQD